MQHLLSGLILAKIVCHFSNLMQKASFYIGFSALLFPACILVFRISTYNQG